MTVNPENDSHNVRKDGYWRCGRADDCELKAGWGTDHVGVGACKLHGGATENAGAPEGNNNAVSVKAWAEDFYEEFLTDAEQERVMKSAEILGENATAKEQAQHAASVCLEQFRRTGDERFLRRYESICDTFNIAPDEEISVDGEVTVDHELSADDKEQLAAMFDVDPQPEDNDEPES